MEFGLAETSVPHAGARRQVGVIHAGKQHHCQQGQALQQVQYGAQPQLFAV